MVHASAPVEILSIVDCVFVNNTRCGGAILVVNATMLSVENSTFYGNDSRRRGLVFCGRGASSSETTASSRMPPHRERVAVPSTPRAPRA